MKKKISLISTAFLISLILLSGCAAKLSSAFDEDKVKNAAENVILMVNEHDTDGLLAVSATELKTVLTDDVLNQIYATTDAAGTYEKIDNSTVIGAQDKNTKKDYATSVLKAKYETKSITYTITFDTDMKLAGIYLK